MRIDDVLKDHGVGAGGKFEEVEPYLAKMNLESDYPESGSNIGTVLSDERFLYVSTLSDYVGIRKYNRDDLSFVMESESRYGSRADAMAMDDNFLYTVGSQTVNKYRRDDLSFISSVRTTTGLKNAVAVDEDYIYTHRTATLKDSTMQKFNKDDLTLVSESASNDAGGVVQTLDVDSDFIYVGTSKTGGKGGLVKYRKTDLSKISSGDGIEDPEGLMVDGEFVYAMVKSGYELLKINKTNLAIVSRTAETFIYGRSIVADKKYVYTCRGRAGSSGLSLGKYDKSDLSLRASVRMDDLPTVGRIAIESNMLYLAINPVIRVYFGVAYIEK